MSLLNCCLHTASANLLYSVHFGVIAYFLVHTEIQGQIQNLISFSFCIAFFVVSLLQDPTEFIELSAFHLLISVVLIVSSIFLALQYF
jgi:hypothetical protein